MVTFWHSRPFAVRLLMAFLLLNMLACSFLDDTASEEVETPEMTLEAAAVTVELHEPSADFFEPTDCSYEDLDADVECGYVSVPADYDDPDSDYWQLAVTILRAPGGAEYPDPVVYLSGGPGGSATDEVEGWLDQPYLEGRDLILFDQRGTGASYPSLNCRELEYEVEESDAELAAACWERLTDAGIEPALFNSALSAADLDWLRQVLGYEEWNLLGVSYGTRLALTAMRDHPEGIRSVILDSVYPPEVNAYEEEVQNGVRAFDLLFADCAAERDCAAAFPDLADRFYELLETLDADPVSFEVVDPWTEEDVAVYLDGKALVDQIFQSMYDTATIPWIPYAMDQIAQENYEEAWVLLLGGESEYQRPRYLVTPQDDDEDLSDSEGVFYSVECYEEIPFNSWETSVALTEALDSPLTPYLLADVENQFDVCEVWEVGAAPAMENRPVSSDIPTLLLAGQYDPITPPAWAESAARHLSRSTLLEFPGVGHSVLDSGECAQSIGLAFFNHPTDRLNTACLDRLGPPEFYLP